MSDPNLLLWNQAIADENWPEAERIQRAADKIGQTIIEVSTELVPTVVTAELE